mgnify:FL=1
MRYKHFSKIERLELSVLLGKDYSQRDCANALQRNPSSVSREIKKNSVNGIYDPHKADHKAYVRRKYSKYQGMKIRSDAQLETYIQHSLEQYHTPEQIAGRLKRINEKHVISFKSIYKYLYTPYGIQYCRYLPYKQHRARKRVGVHSKKQLIPNRTWIEQRPAIAGTLTRIGDFEGDTLGVPRTSNSTIAAFVDRTSKYFLVRKISRLKYAVDAFKMIATSLHVKHTLTLDNGVENVRYQEIGMPTYFCHPYASWQKAQIENMFLRLRRFIPKKQSLDSYSEKDIAVIVDIMNNTPRKCLNYQTPREVYFKEQPSYVSDT